MFMKNYNSDKNNLIFVNMHENRESYTAYNGSHVWDAIYQENCMLERVQTFGLNVKE